MQGVMDTAFAPECPLWGHPDRKEMYIASAVANQMTEHRIENCLLERQHPMQRCYDAHRKAIVASECESKRAFNEK